MLAQPRGFAWRSQSGQVDWRDWWLDGAGSSPAGRGSELDLRIQGDLDRARERHLDYAVVSMQTSPVTWC